jgi:DNA end-binding protein Ku
VPYEELVKGYEISPDQYVVITPEELDSLQPEKTRTIDIEAFVDLDQIDPIYYDHPYYLLPNTGADKAYTLLLEAMKDANKVGIARVVIRSKENLVAIRPRDGVLAMETLLFGDEVVSPDSFDELPEGKDAKASKKEVDMAKQLIGSLETDFDPDEYRDTYRDAVLEMIERKAEGEEIVTQPAEEAAPEQVPDLMAALEASIQGSKRQSKKPARADSSNGAKSKSKTKSKSGSKTATKK